MSSAAETSRRPRLLKQCLLIAVAIIVLGATTAAAPGPDASRIELMMFSYGSLLAFAAGVAIVVKLFVYLLKAAVVLSVLLMVYLFVKFVAEALS